jgi:hypothetical protein
MAHIQATGRTSTVKPLQRQAHQLPASAGLKPTGATRLLKQDFDDHQPSLSSTLPAQATPFLAPE